MKALLVGGTGPTGPHLLRGLLARDYDVTALHRGVHETDDPPDVEHLHADPHFRETLEPALAGRTFDLVLATYGRIRLIAEVVAGRCQRFIGVGGIPIYTGFYEPESAVPYGMKVLSAEDDPVVAEPGETAAAHFSNAIYRAEQRVLELHADGAFAATYFRYSTIYGPRQVMPREWSVVRRVLDGRRTIIVPDGGLAIESRCAAINAAHCVLLAIDRPSASAGQIFNCADDDQLTLRQWIECLANAVGGTLDIVSVPDSLAAPARVLFPRLTASSHRLLSTAKAREHLGYTDVTPAWQALAETAQWYRAHTVTHETHPRFPDRFDYAAEDRLVGAYNAHIAEIQLANVWTDVPREHDYAHPRQPGLSADHRGR